MASHGLFGGQKECTSISYGQFECIVKRAKRSNINCRKRGITSAIYSLSGQVKPFIVKISTLSGSVERNSAAFC